MSPRGAGLALGCADMIFYDVRSDQSKQMYDFTAKCLELLKYKAVWQIKIAQNIKQVFYDRFCVRAQHKLWELF